MAALLALASAAAYGAGDFFGGLAARRAPATAVVLWSHLVGLVGLVVLIPLAGGEATGRALGVGAGAGLIGAVGVVLLYRSLAIGPMSVVAPVTALLAAVVPVVAGFAGGDRPSATAVAGIALALVAIALIAREGKVDVRAVSRPVLAMALAAGLAFGLLFVGLAHVGEDVGVWPLVAARAASVMVFGTLMLVGAVERRLPDKSLARLIVPAGLLDAGANELYLVSLGHGLLSLVAVLAAMYPAGTVILARIVLGERLQRPQQLGLAVAVAAAVLIAV